MSGNKYTGEELPPGEPASRNLEARLIVRQFQALQRRPGHVRRTGNIRGCTNSNRLPCASEPKRHELGGLIRRRPDGVPLRVFR
eukprot:7809567-Heterocapsa_arctica.AAC.1